MSDDEDSGAGARDTSGSAGPGSNQNYKTGSDNIQNDHDPDPSGDRGAGEDSGPNQDTADLEKIKAPDIVEVFKSADFFLVALGLFAAAAGINAIAKGDAVVALVSGVFLIVVITARAITSFLEYWQVILGIALALLSAIFLYAGFYTFSLPRDESWSAWPHIIFSSVLAVAALAAVIHWVSHKDKK